MQVNQLEDELEDAKTSSAAQQQSLPPPPPPPQQQEQSEEELAGLREENANLQRRLSGLQAQVSRC